MLTFTITSKPCSVNSAYISQGRFRKLSPDARAFKLSAGTEILEQLQHLLDVEPGALQPLSGSRLALKLSYHRSNWLTKSGTIRKVDIASYEKLTVDTVFEALAQYLPGLDDSLLFEVALKKIEDGKEYITIEIEVI